MTNRSLDVISSELAEALVDAAIFAAQAARASYPHGQRAEVQGRLGNLLQEYGEAIRPCAGEGVREVVVRWGPAS